MEEAALKNRAEIAEVKRKLIIGELNYDEAKVLASPIIDRINKSSIEKTRYLNKKYRVDRKPFLLDFPSAMRNNY